VIRPNSQFVTNQEPMLIFNSSKPDISNLVTTGHFYFGLTPSRKKLDKTTSASYVFSVFSSHASLQEHFSTWLTLTLKLRHSQMSQRSLVGHGFDQQACPVQKFFLAACEKHPFLGVDLGF
jgi:hypothetical protein